MNDSYHQSTKQIAVQITRNMGLQPTNPHPFPDPMPRRVGGCRKGGVHGMPRAARPLPLVPCPWLGDGPYSNCTLGVHACTNKPQRAQYTSPGKKTKKQENKNKKPKKHLFFRLQGALQGIYAGVESNTDYNIRFESSLDNAVTTQKAAD